MVADPVATAAQHEQELAALDLIEHPVVKAAYQTVAETWLGRAKASPAMRERFDDAFAEVMFSAAVWSSNQDKLRPKVSCITRLAHPGGGRGIRGSRWGLDNPAVVTSPLSTAARCRWIPTAASPSPSTPSPPTGGPTMSAAPLRRTSSTSAMCCWIGAATTRITLRFNGRAAHRERPPEPATSRPRRLRR